jgi:hypothetical protein
LVGCGGGEEEEEVEEEEEETETAGDACGFCSYSFCCLFCGGRTAASL